MAINLTATNQLLELVTTGTGAVHVVASYIDDNAGTKTAGSQTTIISSATTTTIVSAPSGSVIRLIENLNIEAVGSNTITVQKDVGGTDIVLIGPATYSAGQRLEFTSSLGWKKTDAGGGSSGIRIAPSLIPDKFDTTHSPVALYHFDGDANDYSGNALHLTAGTFSFYKPNPSGSRLALAGGSTPARSSFDATLAITGDITIQAIVRLTVPPSGTNTVFAAFTTAGETLATNTLYLLGINGFTQLRWLHEFGAGGTDQQFLSTGTEGPPDIGNIFYVAAVRASNVITFYLNGVALGSSSGTLTAAAGGTSSVFTVNPNSGGAFGCLGLKIINSALNATQIKAEYNLTMGPAFGTIP